MYTAGWRGCKITCQGGYFFTPPKRVTSPTWGPPFPCKRALNVRPFFFKDAKNYGNRLSHPRRKTRFKNVTNAHINRSGPQQHEHARGRANRRNMWHSTMLGIVGQQCVRLHGAIWVRNVLIFLWLSNLNRTELTGRRLTFILLTQSHLVPFTFLYPGVTAI